MFTSGLGYIVFCYILVDFDSHILSFITHFGLDTSKTNTRTLSRAVQIHVLVPIRVRIKLRVRTTVVAKWALALDCIFYVWEAILYQLLMISNFNHCYSAAPSTL